MIYDVKRELRRIELKENRLVKSEPNHALREKLYEKVPEALKNTLQLSFEKAFSLMFLKGRRLIEMSFNSRQLEAEFQGSDYLADKTHSLKSINKVSARVRKNNVLGSAATTATGFSLGFFGMGLPDIPILVGTILKAVYEIAASYGIDYTSREEQIYALRIIRAALLSGAQRAKLFKLLDSPSESSCDLNYEIGETATALSDELLVAKFVQGIPIVGATGGLVNNRVYTKITALAALKYKKRYLIGKLV